MGVAGLESSFPSSFTLAAALPTAPLPGARIGLGVLGRMGTNMCIEFWPDIRRRFFRGKSESPSFANLQPH